MSSSNASSKPAKKVSSKVPELSGKAIFYMCLLALQFGMQPTLTRKYTPNEICRSTVILMQELLKFILAYTMLNISSRGTSSSASTVLKDFTIQTWFQIAMLPAALYALQNICALTAYQHLDALTFNVLNQTKTLSAALCCYIVIKKKQSPIQVFSLSILLLAALVMEKIVPIESLYGSGDSESDEAAEDGDSSSSFMKLPDISSSHWVHGVAPIMVASFLSGLNGALTQKSLQSHGKGGRNPYLFSMELCAASALILTISLLFSNDGQFIIKNGFWYNWTLQTWIPIITNSIGGIIVGLVTKYAGSVRKGFALIFGILLSGVSQAIFDTTSSITTEHIVGGLLAGISLWMHATNPYIPKEKKD